MNYQQDIDRILMNVVCCSTKIFEAPIHLRGIYDKNNWVHGILVLHVTIQLFPNFDHRNEIFL